MSALAQFFDMGGYGDYVWAAYGISITLLVTTMAVYRRRRNRAKVQSQ